MVAIKGLEKFAPRDFPGFISSTVFTGGCNFRCPYCHNGDLVLRPESLPTFPLPFFLNYLDSRKGWLEAVCVSGGEPLMHADCENLLRMIKERNLQVKLETNGSFPSRLRDVIQKGLVDLIAMDVKAPPEKYRVAAGLDADMDAIRESIEIIKTSGRKYVFRTTVVPELIEEEDIKGICGMLEGSDRFQLQQFLPHNTLDGDYLQKTPHLPERLEEFKTLAENYFPEVTLETE